MTGMRRVVLLAVVLGMTLAGCGGAGGGGDESGGGNGGDMGSERVEGPPDVAGTWVGGFEGEAGGTVGAWAGGFEEGGGGTVMLSFGQDGEALTGYETVALVGEEYPFYLGGLSGEVTPEGEVSATASILGAPADEPISFDARVTGSETMEYRGEGARESIELERVRTDLEEGMGIAAVQAVYSRDWVWFSQHGSADLEDRLENDFEDDVDPGHPYDVFTQMLSMQYADQMAYAEEKSEPAMGVRVMLDAESVVTTETASGVAVEFDFETSDGRGGDAYVRLVQAGTAGSGFRYQIDDLSMEYEVEGATYDMSMSQ